MLNVKNISEALAALGTVALVAGCASSQVTSQEVPEKKDEAATVDIPATNETGDAAASTASAEPTPASATATATAVATATAAATAAPTVMGSAKAAGTSTVKKTSGSAAPKKPKDKPGDCGEGGCKM